MSFRNAVDFNRNGD